MEGILVEILGAERNRALAGLTCSRSYTLSYHISWKVKLNDFSLCRLDCKIVLLFSTGFK